MNEGIAETASDESRRDDAARIRQLEERIRVLSETMRAFAEATGDLDGLLDTITQRVTLVIGDSCVRLVLSEETALLNPVSVHARDADRLAQIKAIYAAVPIRLGEHAARTLAEQLGGTIEIVTDHGTHCTLRFSERREDD